jgi:lipoprotein signal peptidase
MKNWYYVLLLALAFAGGAFNLIDRAIGYPGFANTVIDYIPTLWFFNTISNFPDFFILGGVIIFALLYIVLTIVGVSNSGRKSKKDSNEQTQSPKP